MYSVHSFPLTKNKLNPHYEGQTANAIYGNDIECKNHTALIYVA